MILSDGYEDAYLETHAHHPRHDEDVAPTCASCGDPVTCSPTSLDGEVFCTACLLALTDPETVRRLLRLVGASKVSEMMKAGAA